MNSKRHNRSSISNFLIGMGSILNIAGDSNYYETTMLDVKKLKTKSDEEAIASYWENVGGYIKNAMQKIDTEIEDK